MTVRILIFIALPVTVIQIWKTIRRADIMGPHTASAPIGHTHEIAWAEFVVWRKGGCSVQVNNSAVYLVGTISTVFFFEWAKDML